MSRNPVRSFDTLVGALDLARRALQIHLQRSARVARPSFQEQQQQQKGSWTSASPLDSHRRSAPRPTPLSTPLPSTSSAPAATASLKTGSPQAHAPGPASTTTARQTGAAQEPISPRDQAGFSNRLTSSIASLSSSSSPRKSSWPAQVASSPSSSQAATASREAPDPAPLKDVSHTAEQSIDEPSSHAPPAPPPDTRTLESGAGQTGAANMPPLETTKDAEALLASLGDEESKIQSSQPPASAAEDADLVGTAISGDADAPREKRAMLKASRVPTSRFARLFQYGSLAAGMSVGAAGATLSRFTGGQASGSSPMFTEANIRRIVSRLSRMRGAALKLGQFLSIQESKLLPPEIESILAKVQNAADYMPEWQTRSVLEADLGRDWETKFATFDMIPFAAASIGQVHSGTLLDGREVAVKIQFPGVADSIDSDISTLRSLLTFSALLPRGLYLDNTLRVMKRELRQECDYEREAESGRRFARHLAGDPHLAVPEVIDELSSPRVLTTEMMYGKPLAKSTHLSQETKDHIGTTIISLCLRELFQFRFMQTDPNWSNFLWNDKTRKLELVDFGASQPYDHSFIDMYKRLLLSAVDGRKEDCIALSREIGYLTDSDNELMINAHVETMLALAEPFKTEGLYAFGQQDITKKVQANIPIMLRHRTTPPPEATYSLNRKLSGCFLLCARLAARVDCHRILHNV